MPLRQLHFQLSTIWTLGAAGRIHLICPSPLEEKPREVRLLAQHKLSVSCMWMLPAYHRSRILHLSTIIEGRQNRFMFYRRCRSRALLIPMMGMTKSMPDEMLIRLQSAMEII